LKSTKSIWVQIVLECCGYYFFTNFDGCNLQQICALPWGHIERLWLSVTGEGKYHTTLLQMHLNLATFAIPFHNKIDIDIKTNWLSIYTHIICTVNLPYKVYMCRSSKIPIFKFHQISKYKKHSIYLPWPGWVPGNSGPCMHATHQQLPPHLVVCIDGASIGHSADHSTCTSLGIREILLSGLGGGLQGDQLSTGFWLEWEKRRYTRVINRVMKEVIVALLAVFAVIILIHFEHLFSVSSENSWAVHGREHFLGSSNAPLGFHGRRPAQQCQDALGHRVQGDADGSKPLALNGRDIHVGTERFGPLPHVSSPPWLRPPRWNFQTLAQVPPLEQLALAPPQPPVQGYLSTEPWDTEELGNDTTEGRNKYFKRSTLEENQNRLSKMFLILS